MSRPVLYGLYRNPSRPAIWQGSAGSAAAYSLAGAAPSLGGFPNLTIGDPNGRPVITQLSPSVVMSYTNGAGQALTTTLRPLPALNATFGVDATTGITNNGAFHNPGGWIDITVPNTLVDSYDFSASGVGNVMASDFTISRCWFHNIDGQDSWAVWVHPHGALNNMTIVDCLVSGTSTSVTGPSGLLKHDGAITGVRVIRCAGTNTNSFIQFVPISGPGTLPYVNVVQDCYMGVVSDPSNLGLHLENLNVSDGTGGLLVSHNTIIGPSGQTAAIYIAHDFGDVGNITCDNNLIGGGPQIVTYQGDTGAAGGVLIATAGNMKFTNNKLMTGNPGFGSIGLVTAPNPGDPRVIYSGNVSYPSLTPIPGL